MFVTRIICLMVYHLFKKTRSTEIVKEKVNHEINLTMYRPLAKKTEIVIVT